VQDLQVDIDGLASDRDHASVDLWNVFRARRLVLVGRGSNFVAANKENETMVRKFDPINLVQLPALDALATQTLGTAVLAAAANKTLPEPIADALADLTVAVDALQAIAIQRLPRRGDPRAARDADLSLDAAWGVLYNLLGAWSRLPDHPHAQLATTLRKQLFPDGLRFTHLRFRAEWAESENRLQAIDERGWALQIEQLGAAGALAQIRQAHAHYGEVLSIVTARPVEPSLSVRDARAAVMRALRVFIVRVAASVRAQNPASADLARDLLAPLETWGTIAPTKPAPTPAPVTADYAAGLGSAVTAPPQSAN
jgi:hypothetical protein